MKFRTLLIASAILFSSQNLAIAGENKTSQFVENYSKLVYANYKDAYIDAKEMQKKILDLLDNPNEANLKKAKFAWLIARDSYGQTEIFRFQDGPIDFVDNKRGLEGPEGRLNSWPLDEAYIDYVVGNKKAGIINNPAQEITKANLIAKNQEENEANVSLGYHAIEFLLWGQDFSLEKAGQRSFLDFENEKRKKYLKLTTEILIEDLEFLLSEWKPSIFRNNHVKSLKKQSEDEVVGNILTSLATLSGFELASERMAVPLDSGDQEDEHSCFSDNTHNDFIYNIKGIENVYLGKYNNIDGIGIYDILAKKDQELADKITKRISFIIKLSKDLPTPIDKILASKKGSDSRVKMERIVENLQALSLLFKKAGNKLGVEVSILTE